MSKNHVDSLKCCPTVCAGTLTCNDMAVVRLWLGGRDHAALQRLPTWPRPLQDPLKLDPGSLRLLTEGIALNSSACLEPSLDAEGAERRLWCQAL